MNAPNWSRLPTRLCFRALRLWCRPGSRLLPLLLPLRRQLGLL